MTQVPPAASSKHVLTRMKAVRRRDTGLEVEVRSLLHRRGLRYRVDQIVVPECRSRADVVFRHAKVAVFIDGCFWHMCPEHRTMPKQNSHWWREKLAENRKRDRRATRALNAAGWCVIRIWGHEDAAHAAANIARVVRRRTRAVTR